MTITTFQLGGVELSDFFSSIDFLHPLIVASASMFKELMMQEVYCFFRASKGIMG